MALANASAKSVSDLKQMGLMLVSMLKTKKIDGLPLKERIERSSMPVTECGCWIWLKSGTKIGYGQISIGKKMVSAHRASWMAYRGPIPAGLHVLHSCDVPSCVNPDHLSLGTRVENQRQVWARGRRNGSAHLSYSLVPTSKAKRVGFSLGERIERGSIPVTECGCWIWMGTTRLGYGRLNLWPSGQTISAHRVSYEEFKGTIPKGMHVLHSCDIPSCVNPDHLFLGTHIDNMADRKRKRRYASYHGEDHPLAKLTNKKVLEIRASAEGRNATARKYGVTPPLIGAIRSRRIWKHI